MIGPRFRQEVEICGPAGDVHALVTVEFDYPLSWTPTMANVVERELQNAITRIVEEAKKTL